MAEEIEALKAELEELKSGNEALAAKNRELLGEVKRERNKNREIDPDKFYEVQEQLEKLQVEHKQLQKKYEKETGELSAIAQQKDTTLKNVLIDGGLSDSLAKAGVKPEFLEATKALLRSQAKLVDSDSGYMAVIGDAPLSEYISSWAENDGKHFVAAPASSGGSAGGGSGGGGTEGSSKYFDKKHPEFSLTKQAEIMKSNPELYAKLKG